MKVHEWNGLSIAERVYVCVCTIENSFNTPKQNKTRNPFATFFICFVILFIYLFIIQQSVVEGERRRIHRKVDSCANSSK